MIRVLQYLLCDTLLTWLSSPFRVLTKIGVSALLCAIAVGILMTFALINDALRAQLESFGSTRVWLQEPYDGVQFGYQLRDSLDPSIHQLRLTQATTQAKIFDEKISVSSYEWQDLKSLGLEAFAINNGRNAILLTTDYPSGTKLPAELNKNLFEVVCCAPPQWAQVLPWRTPLLLVQNTHPALPSTHLYQIWTRMECQSQSQAQHLAEYLRQHCHAIKTPVQIHASDKLWQQLQQVSAQQQQWRMGIFAIVLPSLCLILGALTILEFHQQQHLSALMRSFGIHWSLLWIKHIIESLALTLCGALTSLIVMLAYAPTWLPLLGTETKDIEKFNALRFMTQDGLWILSALTLGAFVSTLPIALGLRKPIGRILP